MIAAPLPRWGMWLALAILAGGLPLAWPCPDEMEQIPVELLQIESVDAAISLWRLKLPVPELELEHQR